MKLPNKVTPFSESIMPKMVTIYKKIINCDIEIFKLYESVKKSMSLSEFIDVLDCLFLIGKIDLKGGRIVHVA